MKHFLAEGIFKPLQEILGHFFKLVYANVKKNRVVRQESLMGALTNLNECESEIHCDDDFKILLQIGDEKVDLIILVENRGENQLAVIRSLGRLIEQEKMERGSNFQFIEAEIRGSSLAISIPVQSL